MNAENVDVKQELFEEFFVPETVLHLGSTKTDLEHLCSLCPDGLKLQNDLIDHINVEHPDLHPDDKVLNESTMPLMCCECPQGMRIQTKLINHLLSHFSIKQEAWQEEDSIRLDACFSVSTEGQHPRELKRKCSRNQTQRNQKHDLENYFRDRETKRFICKICEKSFLYKQGVLKHIDSEHNPNEIRPQKAADDSSEAAKVKCSSCSKVFKYKQGVKKHWELEHNPENLFPCPKTECSSRCKTLKNLHAHIRTHDPPRKESLDNLQCSKCLKYFQSPKQLYLHSYTHREKFFCCDKCGLKFNNKEQVKNHVLRHVGLFQKKVYYQRIVCDQCSMMVFTHKMKRHKLVHHSDEKPFKCDFVDCNAAFSDNRILSDHMNIHLKLKPYKCEFCSESFRSGANLRLHRIRHTDPNRHRCNECQTSFVTKQALQKHLRRHTEDPDIRPFACDYPGCNGLFKQKDHVRNHIRRTHEKTDEIFYCELCTKSYDRKDALGKHLRKSHSITKRKSRVFPIDIE